VLTGVSRAPPFAARWVAVSPSPTSHGINAVTQDHGLTWTQWVPRSRAVPMPLLLQLADEVLEHMDAAWPGVIGGLQVVCKHFRRLGCVRRAFMIDVLRSARVRGLDERDWWHWPVRRYARFAAAAPVVFHTPQLMQQVLEAAFEVDAERHQLMGVRQPHEHAFPRVLGLLVEFGRRAGAEWEVQRLVGMWVVHVWGGYFAVRGLEEVRADGPDSMFWRRDTSEDIGMLAVQALAGLGGPAEWK